MTLASGKFATRLVTQLSFVTDVKKIVNMSEIGFTEIGTVI